MKAKVTVLMDKDAISAMIWKYAKISCDRNAQKENIALIDMSIKAALISIWVIATLANNVDRSILSGSFAGIICMDTVKRVGDVQTITLKFLLMEIS